LAKAKTKKIKQPPVVKASSKPDEATDAEKWLEKIHRAQKVREKWRERFRVTTAYEYFEGAQRPSHVNEKEWITINLIYSTLLAMLPTMYPGDPYFYIRLRRSYDQHPMSIALYEQKGKVRQSMLNYIKTELKLKTKARLSTQDAIFQYGILKICYHADWVANPDWSEEKKDEEPRNIPVYEAYKLLRVHPDDFLVDEDAGPLDDDVTWKAQRLKLPLEDVKKDTRFRAAARKIITASEVREDYQRQREEKKKGGMWGTEGEHKEPDVAVLYELYHRKKKEWLVVAEGCREFLIKPEETPPGIEKDPFADLRFTLRDDSWYPIPPASQWIDPQTAYCERRSKIATHNKRFNRKYQLSNTGFEDAEAAAALLENGEDGTVIITQTPGDHVVPIKDAPLDMQVHTEVAYAKNDFNELSVGANQRGATQGIESATEAGILEVRAQTREGDWVGLVNDFTIDAGRKTDQQVQTHITRDEAIKVTGPEGEYWQLVKQTDYEEIAGEYEYAINAGRGSPQLPEIERAQWMSFLSLLGSAPLLGTSQQLLKETARMFKIDNEILIQELHKLAMQVATGQVQQPGQQGSQPNVSRQNPQSAQGGQAFGIANMRGGA
jgi:hypothetical protein